MPPVSQSREVLTAMDSGQPLPTLSFGRKNGCFVSKNVALVLAALFLGSLLATGLLVFYYATPHRVDAAQASSLTTPNEASSLVPSTAGIIGTPPPVTTTTSQLVQTTTTEAPPPKKTIDVRLPRSIMPIRYVVRLQPLINGNFSILGSVEITMKILEPTKNVTLHMADIISKNDTIKLQSADNSSASAVRINEHKYDVDREFYIAMLDEELMKGEQYVLSMDFEGYLNDQLKGFYRSSYVDETGQKKMLTTTQFQATDARRAFPCFDEPALKAEFEIYLARQTNMSAISNMPRIDTMPIDDQPDWVWDHFNTSVPMSTYLVAFVVSDFVHINSTANNNTLFRVWARKEAIDQAEYAKQIGPDITTFFEEYFSIPFPLPKQDMIALPDFSAGAMENWGLITYRETALLYDPAVSSASSKQRVAAVVAHELAHQWFGDLVTPSWWTDLWLSEGFATYMATLALHELHPEWKSLEHFVVSRLQRVMVHDSSLAANAVRTAVPDPNHMHEVFTAIVYSKGASIIRMMQHFLSEPTFKTGVANYLNKFQFDSAGQEDFLEVMDEAAQETGALIGGISLHTIMNTWTLQPGYPVLYVNRPDNSTATIKQKRFHFGMNDAASQEDEYTDGDLRWWIPVTFTDQRYPYFEHTRPRTWLRPQDDELPVTGLPPLDRWVIFNLQQTGYMRVNYDLGNWHLLLVQLLTDHTTLPPTHRAQILDDALNLARAGVVPYHVALNITQYLRHDEALAPWQAAFSNFEYLHTMLRSSPVYGALKSYLEWVMRPVLESVGLQDSGEDDMTLQLLRTHLEEWACRLDLPECLDLVQELNAALLDNSTNYLHTEHLRVGGVYCAAVRRGGERVWMSVWRLFSRTPHPDMREALGQALGCTTEMWLMNRFLRSGLRGADLADALRWARQTDVGQEVAWQYVWNNRRTLMRAPQIFPTIIESLAEGFFSEHHQYMLSRLLESLSADTRQTLKGVEKAVTNNVNWHRRSYQPFKSWLEDAGFSSNFGETFSYTIL